MNARDRLIVALDVPKAEAARALVDRALKKMNPALVVGWHISGNVRMQGGEYEEALARYQRCLHLDPQSPWRTYVWPSMDGCRVAMGSSEPASSGPS